MENLNNLRPLSEDELKDKLSDARKKIMEMEFKRKVSLDKPHQYKNLKKEIARILTLISEKRKEALKKKNKGENRG